MSINPSPNPLDFDTTLDNLHALSRAKCRAALS